LEEKEEFPDWKDMATRRITFGEGVVRQVDTRFENLI